MSPFNANLSLNRLQKNKNNLATQKIQFRSRYCSTYVWPLDVRHCVWKGKRRNPWTRLRDRREDGETTFPFWLTVLRLLQAAGRSPALFFPFQDYFQNTQFHERTHWIPLLRAIPPDEKYLTPLWCSLRGHCLHCRTSRSCAPHLGASWCSAGLCGPTVTVGSIGKYRVKKKEKIKTILIETIRFPDIHVITQVMSQPATMKINATSCFLANLGRVFCTQTFQLFWEVKK